MAITEQDAGDSDRRRPICRRGTELLTAALIMHVPAHGPKWRAAREIALIWINVWFPSLRLECPDPCCAAVQGSFFGRMPCFTIRTYPGARCDYSQSVGGEHDGPASARLVFECGDITRIEADDRPQTIGGRVVPRSSRRLRSSAGHPLARDRSAIEHLPVMV